MYSFKPLTRFLALSLVLSLGALNAHADNPRKKKSNSEWKQISDSVISDLVASGIGIGAAFTRSVPIALSAGIITKYVSVYGIAGIKTLIATLKGAPLEDLGELNVAYVYLMASKSKLLREMGNMREIHFNPGAYRETDGSLSPRMPDENSRGMTARYEKEFDALSSFAANLCPDAQCPGATLDEKLVNETIVNTAMAAKQSVNYRQALNEEQLKATYHSLVILYLDIIFVEQRILASLQNVLATQVSNVIESIEENPHLSQAEREYNYQLMMNVVLKWKNLQDGRRVGMTPFVQSSILQLETESNEIQDRLRTTMESIEKARKEAKKR